AGVPSQKGAPERNDPESEAFGVRLRHANTVGVGPIPNSRWHKSLETKKALDSAIRDCPPSSRGLSPFFPAALSYGEGGSTSHDQGHRTAQIMKLTSIPQLARNANRLREILTILSKYGLADWISHLDWDFAKGLFKSSEGRRLGELTHETRIRLALTE